MIYDFDGEARWLLTEPQLRAYLDERGVQMAGDVPIAARWRGTALYDARTALAFCEAQPEEWWT